MSCGPSSAARTSSRGSRSTSVGSVASAGSPRGASTVHLPDAGPGNAADTRRGTGSLVQRALAAVLFLPLLVILARAGGFAFLLLVELVVFFGLREFFQLAKRVGLHPDAGLGVAGGMALVAAAAVGGVEGAGAALAVVAGVAWARELTPSRPGNTFANVGSLLLGLLYVAGSAAHLLLLRALEPAGGARGWGGAGFAMLPFLLAWSGDTGAYFVGRAWGRRALLPRVSPGKTWEGLLGGAAATVAAAFLARGRLVPEMSAGPCLLLGAAAALLGPLGDLSESALKRQGGVKDASTLIPGHGGALDRFDSLFFVTPAVYYIVRFVIRP